VYYIIQWQQKDANLAITDWGRERVLDAASGFITQHLTTHMFCHARTERKGEMEDAPEGSKSII
jgi:hypothetical protein